MANAKLLCELQFLREIITMGNARLELFYMEFHNLINTDQDVLKIWKETEFNMHSLINSRDELENKFQTKELTNNEEEDEKELSISDLINDNHQNETDYHEEDLFETEMCVDIKHEPAETQDFDAFAYISARDKAKRRKSRKKEKTHFLIPLKELITEDSNLKVFPTNRGFSYAATFKGFSYTYFMDGKDRRVFRCAERTKGCTGKIYLHLDYKSVVESVPESFHNHGADLAKCNSRYLKALVKLTATTSCDSSAAIFESHLHQVPKSSLGSVPTLNNLRRMVKRARERKEQN